MKPHSMHALLGVVTSLGVIGCNGEQASLGNHVGLQTSATEGTSESDGSMASTTAATGGSPDTTSSGAATTTAASTSAATTGATTTGTSSGMKFDITFAMDLFQCPYDALIDACVGGAAPPDVFYGCAPLPDGLTDCSQCEPDCASRQLDKIESPCTGGCMFHIDKVWCGPYEDPEYPGQCCYVLQGGGACAE